MHPLEPVGLLYTYKLLFFIRTFRQNTYYSFYITSSISSCVESEISIYIIYIDKITKQYLQYLKAGIVSVTKIMVLTIIFTCFYYYYYYEYDVLLR